jgi:predicted phosphoribosyltransferase
MFRDREEAGRLLAELLKKYDFDKENTVILAIPRGGVPVAYEVSKKLGIPFSLVITKKLAPLREPEAAFGAIAPDASQVIDEVYMKYMGVSSSELEIVRENAVKEIKNRIIKYLNEKEPSLEGKDVIIIDDGIATGYTAIAAAMYVKNKGAKNVYLAIPVCPTDSIPRVKKYFDDVFCYEKSDSPFFAVGTFYEDFHQVSDQEMFFIIEEAKKNGLFYT